MPKRLTKYGNPKRNLKEEIEPTKVKKVLSFLKKSISWIVAILVPLLITYYALFPQIKIDPMSESLDPKNLFKRPIKISNDGLLFEASKIEYFCNIFSAEADTGANFKNFLTTYDQTPLPNLRARESMTAFCTFPFKFEKGEVKSANLNLIVKYDLFFWHRKRVFPYTVKKNANGVDLWMSRSASEK